MHMLIIALLLQAVLRSFGTHVWRPIDNRLMEESRRTRLVRSPAYDHLVNGKNVRKPFETFCAPPQGKKKRYARESNQRDCWEWDRWEAWKHTLNL